MTMYRVQAVLFAIAVAHSVCGTVNASPLLSHVDVSVGGGVWSYTVFNDQPSGDSSYISSFTLQIAAPISVITAPDGWTFGSDNASYVQWFNIDPSLPYPHDIAPGMSLSGFSVTSTAAFSAPLCFVD